MKNYKVKIIYKGIFGSVDIIKVEDVKEEDQFYYYKDNCFIVYGAVNDKSIYYSFPLDKIKCINIEEI